jgi:hypothetical protein
MSLATSSSLIQSSKRRRQVGGINKAEAIKAFKSSRAHFDAGEPDLDRSSGDKARPSRKKRRITYLREKKLQAITYLILTDMPKKGGKAGEVVPISLTYAGA